MTQLIETRMMQRQSPEYWFVLYTMLLEKTSSIFSASVSPCEKGGCICLPLLEILSVGREEKEVRIFWGCVTKAFQSGMGCKGKWLWLGVTIMPLVAPYRLSQDRRAQTAGIEYSVKGILLLHKWFCWDLSAWGVFNKHLNSWKYLWLEIQSHVMHAVATH